MFKTQEQTEIDLFNNNFDLMFPNKNINYNSEDDELPINTFNHIDKSLNRRKIEKNSKNIIAKVFMDNDRIHEDYLCDNSSTEGFINAIRYKYSEKIFKVLVVIPPSSTLNDGINKLIQNSLYHVADIWEIVVFGGCTMVENDQIVSLQKIKSNNYSLPCLDPYVFCGLNSDSLEKKSLKLCIFGRNHHYKEYLKLINKKGINNIRYENILEVILPILNKDDTIPFVKDYSVWKDIFTLNKLDNFELISKINKKNFIDENNTILNINFGKLDFIKNGFIIKNTKFNIDEKKQICLKYCQLIFKENELSNYMGFIEDLFNQYNKGLNDFKVSNSEDINFKIDITYQKYNLKFKLEENETEFNNKTKILLQTLFEFIFI